MSFAPTSHSRDGVAVAAVGSNIVVFGGNVDGQLSDRVFVLDTVSLDWSAVNTPPNCVVPRTHHQAVRLRNSLAVIGGRSHGSSYAPTVDVFDMRDKTWTSKPIVGQFAQRERFAVVPVC